MDLAGWIVGSMSSATTDGSAGTTWLITKAFPTMLTVKWIGRGSGANISSTWRSSRAARTPPSESSWSEGNSRPATARRFAPVLAPKSTEASAIIVRKLPVAAICRLFICRTFIDFFQGIFCPAPRLKWFCSNGLKRATEADSSTRYILPVGIHQCLYCCHFTVIAHPTSASGSTGSLAASTKRRMSSTEARFALAVLTTERKAA